MLTLEQIKQSYLKKNVSLKSSLVEYLQCEILDSLFKQKGSEKLSFMGGTAIRIVYEGNRFSEDLDFDNFGISFPEFEDILKKVVLDMKLKGFFLEFRLVEKGAYHSYIKFPQILKKAGISQLKDEKILIRIDTVKKEKIFLPENFLLNKFDVYRTILVSPLPVILSQKLLTALERKREKGRDFYDVNFLWGRTNPDFSYLKKVSGLEKKEFIRIFLEKCQKLDFNSLAKDVEPFLINPEQIERVKGFLRFIQEKSENIDP